MIEPELRHTDNDTLIQLLTSRDALDTLEHDLKQPTPVLAWAYLIEPEWFREMFATPLRQSNVQLLVDHRQRRTVQKLLHEEPNLHARSWSWNRTLHDKTLMLPQRNTIWLCTHNWTKGSWTLSTNRAARIVSRSTTTDLLKVWMSDYAQSRPIIPKKN